MEAVAVRQTDVLGAAEKFAKLETILPASESSHAILRAIREAERCHETGEAKTILFGIQQDAYCPPARALARGGPFDSGVIRVTWRRTSAAARDNAWRM